jgi:hypothetical protein
LQSSTTYFVHESWNHGIRKAQIHLATCRRSASKDETDLRSEARQECWHGPFNDLASARAASDLLPTVALRSECRCVRRTLRRDVLVLQDRPYTGAETRPTQRPRKRTTRKPRKLAAAARRAAPAKTAQKRRPPAYFLMGLLLLLGGGLFAVPSITVEEAGNSSPPHLTSFFFLNTSPISVTNVEVDCDLDFKPTAVHLRKTQLHVTDRLGFRQRAAVPCFAAFSESLPSSKALALEVTVSYTVLGVRRIRRTLLFEPARNMDGIYRWAYLK